jgi:hypothetical protein
MPAVGQLTSGCFEKTPGFFGPAAIFIVYKDFISKSLIEVGDLDNEKADTSIHLD